MSNQKPLFSFGVVTDIQYADLDNRSNYRFRDVPPKLEACINTWNNHDLEFNIQLGDLIQGNRQHTPFEFECIASILDKSSAPVWQVIGNHCLELPLSKLHKRLGFDYSYTSFSKQGFRFLILNSMDVSIYSQPYNSESYQEALAYLSTNPVVKKWSGALSQVQKSWLKSELLAAQTNNERVVVFNHLPIHENTTDVQHGILWYHEEIRHLLHESGVVVAYLNGHYHKGGYEKEGGLHFVTLEALVESPEGENAFGIVEVYDNRLEINGYGSLSSRTLDF